LAFLVANLVLGGARPAAAAAGNTVADVITPEGAVFAIGVAFDGQYLYYLESSGSVLHRIDVPPPCGDPCVPTAATGHVDIPIVAPLNPFGLNGLNALSYDKARGVFWAAGGDGLSIYRVTKTGIATLAFAIQPLLGERPGDCKMGFCWALIDGLAYDASDDTLWYKPDASNRIYHYHTYGSLLGTAVLASPAYVDTDVAPNDLASDCGFNYPSWVVVGGGDLFVGADRCEYYFEYAKAGAKLARTSYNFRGTPDGDAECDDQSYAVSVIWTRDVHDGHIRAFEQPSAGACAFGG
jgi:hypothetical protein